MICGLQSSVVLESAIAGKRLIFPLFYDYLSSPYSNDFFWKDYTELFDVATNKDQFKKIFRNSLNDVTVSNGVQYKRNKLFIIYSTTHSSFILHSPSEVFLFTKIKNPLRKIFSGGKLKSLERVKFKVKLILLLHVCNNKIFTA